jgi:hypothetical protein
MSQLGSQKRMIDSGYFEALFVTNARNREYFYGKYGV